MKIRTIIAATCAALAFSMAGAVSAHDGEAQTVTKNFEAANIPGKSLIALEVDYAPGAASPSHTHAKSAFIYAYVALQDGDASSENTEGHRRAFERMRTGTSSGEDEGCLLQG
jgi:hypothetical protein